LIEGSINKISQSLRTAIAASPGDLIEDSSGLLKVTSGVLKGIPYVGTIASITFGAVSVADGSETPKQAVAETAGSVAGGALGAASGAEVGAAAGSIFPGVGTLAGGKPAMPRSGRTRVHQEVGMRGVRYLVPEGLPPKPDPATGLPRPPRAPGRGTRQTSKRRADLEKVAADAPQPPPGEGPVFAWYRSGRSYAVQVAVIGSVATALILSARDGFHFHWVRFWWAWSILILVGVLIGLTQRRGTKCSAGVEWLCGRKSWVRTYELASVKLSVGVGQFYLNMQDQNGHRLSVPVQSLQEDQLMWDLVYNGVLHSVIAGGAETNGQLHRYLRVPYPSPYDAAR
jgi:hypothetical protein